MKDTIKYVEEAKSPRIIKTHLPLSMLPPNLLDVSKVVFVARNVKDVCVSFFHMEQIEKGPLLNVLKDNIDIRNIWNICRYWAKRGQRIDARLM